jgi:excisionase family DNA binding protein
MTVEELSDYIKISRNILYKGIREKTLHIPYFKINKAARFLKTDVDAWIDMCRENTGPEVVASLKPMQELLEPQEINGNSK